VADSNISAAKDVLGLSHLERCSTADLRKAYRSLARQYHPDKNSDGREVFERVQTAYELLSSIELDTSEKTLGNIILIVQTQIIVYRRFPQVVENQKYPCYTMLLDAMNLDDKSAEGRRLLQVGTQLLHHTCATSPFNTKELIKCQGVAKVSRLLLLAMGEMRANGGDPGHGRGELLAHVLNTCSSVALFPGGRDALRTIGSSFAECVTEVLTWRSAAPQPVEAAVELVAHCAAEGDLQNAFLHAGVLWKLLPMLMAYDSTLAEGEENLLGDVSGARAASIYNQKAGNRQAQLAARALGRLGGCVAS
jgi:DnaJ family protein C protein 13